MAGIQSLSDFTLKSVERSAFRNVGESPECILMYAKEQVYAKEQASWPPGDQLAVDKN